MTVATCVCWSMISLIQTQYGSGKRRQGRSRLCLAYQANRRGRSDLRCAAEKNSDVPRSMFLRSFAGIKRLFGEVADSNVCPAGQVRSMERGLGCEILTSCTGVPSVLDGQ